MLETMLALMLCAAPADEAQFTFSKDPTRAVLHITEYNMKMESRTATFFGDGRVEITARLRPQSDHYELRITPERLEQVLRSAVRGGLAELNWMEIQRRILAEREGIPYLPPEDGAHLRILLALDSYSRGDYALDHLARTITVASPRAGKRVFGARIPEFAAIVELQDLLHRLVDEALAQR